LAQQKSDQVAGILLESWPEFGPQARRSIVDALTRNPSWTAKLLEAVKSGEVHSGELDREIKQSLQAHRDAKIRAAATQLFAGDFSANRAKVVADYRAAIEREGDAARGKLIFEKRCSVCHRVGETGYAVGPDLASVQNKS